MKSSCNEPIPWHTYLFNRRRTVGYQRKWKFETCLEDPGCFIGNIRGCDRYMEVCWDVSSRGVYRHINCFFWSSVAWKVNSLNFGVGNHYYIFKLHWKIFLAITSNNRERMKYMYSFFLFENSFLGFQRNYKKLFLWRNKNLSSNLVWKKFLRNFETWYERRLTNYRHYDFRSSTQQRELRCNYNGDVLNRFDGFTVQDYLDGDRRYRN